MVQLNNLTSFVHSKIAIKQQNKEQMSDYLILELESYFYHCLWCIKLLLIKKSCKVCWFLSTVYDVSYDVLVASENFNCFKLITFYCHLGCYSLVEELKKLFADYRLL